jgi:hypothetical protein
MAICKPFDTPHHTRMYPLHTRQPPDILSRLSPASTHPLQVLCISPPHFDPTAEVARNNPYPRRAVGPITPSGSGRARTRTLARTPTPTPTPVCMTVKCLCLFHTHTHTHAHTRVYDCKMSLSFPSIFFVAKVRRSSCRSAACTQPPLPPSPQILPSTGSFSFFSFSAEPPSFPTNFVFRLASQPLLPCPLGLLFCADLFTPSLTSHLQCGATPDLLTPPAISADFFVIQVLHCTEGWCVYQQYSSPLRSLLSCALRTVRDVRTRPLHMMTTMSRRMYSMFLNAFSTSLNSLVVLACPREVDGVGPSDVSLQSECIPLPIACTLCGVVLSHFVCAILLVSNVRLRRGGLSKITFYY